MPFQLRDKGILPDYHAAVVQSHVGDQHAQAGVPVHQIAVDIGARLPELEANEGQKQLRQFLRVEVAAQVP